MQPPTNKHKQPTNNTITMPAATAAGKRPDPFRTRKLSPPAPMVLHPTGRGRVGHRRHLTIPISRRGGSLRRAPPSAYGGERGGDPPKGDRPGERRRPDGPARRSSGQPYRGRRDDRERPGRQ